MTNYESMDDLASHIDNEGLGYHIQHYIDWNNITIAGVPLPAEIVKAAKEVREGLDLIDKWLPSL